MLAFRALQQGLRFAYENWRMWMNYMIVAMDVGELSEAARALGRIVEERAAKAGANSVDVDVLDRERRHFRDKDPSEGVRNGRVDADQVERDRAARETCYFHLQILFL